MVTQRRYSVTGQTPPDDAEAMARSPKLQPLDSSVQAAGCALREHEAAASKFTASSETNTGEPVRGRTMAQPGTIVRTSSKRSATQLPNSPSHELPPKVARRKTCRNLDVDMDTDTDSDVADVSRRYFDHEDNDQSSNSQVTSVPSTPGTSHSSTVVSLPDTTTLEHLQLSAEDDSDDDCMEDFALSVSHSRNHSHDAMYIAKRQNMHPSWEDLNKAAWMLAGPQVSHIEQLEPPEPDNSHQPLTFLTLPPEIRHQVYRHCENLVVNKPLVYCISIFDGEIQHPLGSVSRLVRNEALAIFYSYNTWVIKVEFQMMYDAFRDWIIRLGEGAGLLRHINFSVRGALFKPARTAPTSVMFNGQLFQTPQGMPGAINGGEFYSPQDGDASFKIDLSEKFTGGKVQLVRNDGAKEAGVFATQYLARMVSVLWTKRQKSTLNGQDWISMVDEFINFIGRKHLFI